LPDKNICEIIDYCDNIDPYYSISGILGIPLADRRLAGTKGSVFLRRIYLFGSLRVQDDHGLRRLSGERVQNLLAYLVLHPRIPHRRELLADLLSPDASPERVRRNFSDTLYRLKKALSPEWLVIDAVTIALDSSPEFWVDGWEFERLAASEQEVDLHRAVELYTGDLLPELYDDWLVPEREFFRSQYLSALERLAALQESSGELRQALLSLRRLVSAEPLHEPAHQAYLRLLGRMQRYGEALAHYEYLRGLLRSELDTEPLAETRLIAQSIERERDLATVRTEIGERLPFVGRKTERAAVLTVIEAMLKGQGAILAIEGEAGIGKSRLLREIAASIRWRGATLYQGAASEIPSASPYSPLQEALAPLVNSPRGVQLESLLEDETLAALAPLNPVWKEKTALFDMQPEGAVKRYYDALHIFGKTLAQLAPTVLIFDDLHWAGPALWKSLEVLAGSLVRSGALLVVTYRRPEIERNPGWEVIQAWDRDGQLKTIPLLPLNVEEVAQLIGEAQPAEPAEVHAWTGGNPFYISEWLAAPGLNNLARQDTTAHRRATLSPTARFALESASVLGEAIPYRLWVEISGLPPLSLAGLSDELVSSHWLQPSAPGYAFAHHLIRSVIYDEIEASRRRALHERAASAYLSLEPDNLRARAFHLDQAGQLEDAARAYRLAGEQDLTRFAFREAQNALDRALTLMPATASIERLETAIALAEACDATGDRVRQGSSLEEALTFSTGSDTHRLQTLLAYTRFATHTGQIAEAEKQLEAALALARRLGEHARESEAITLFTNLAIEQGKWNEAHQWSLLALEQARSSGNRSIEGRSLRHVGIVARAMGKPAESIQWLEKALALQRTLGDRLQVSITQTNLLPAFYELGAWDLLIATAQGLVPIKDALGDRLGAAITRHNQALAYYALGDYGTARRILERVIQDSEAVLSRRRVGLARNVLGLVAEGEGNWEEALSLYRSALSDAEAVEAVTEAAYAQHDLGALLLQLQQPFEAVSLLESARTAWIEQDNLLLRVKSEAFLGLALLAIGDRAGAEELTASGWATFQSGIPVGEHLQDWLWALYRLLVAFGQSKHAHAVLRAAYAELQRQGRAIDDQDLRRSFFESVQLNREIVKAYDQLADIPREISVSLARRDVPLGRTLRQDEFITVEWTLSAPEDEAIANKSERRRNRLKRLLAQAEKQGAAPTDDDLAKALGVSRRTILRDLHAMAHEIETPPTRKRLR
jgi:DNA-binding SARP family transcriptional activator/predicted ATPase